jgi:hypothetical protein
MFKTHQKNQFGGLLLNFGALKTGCGCVFGAFFCKKNLAFNNCIFAYKYNYFCASERKKTFLLKLGAVTALFWCSGVFFWRVTIIPRVFYANMFIIYRSSL